MILTGDAAMAVMPERRNRRSVWTIARARAIGLAGKDNWKHYPRNMLRARCISEAVRAVYPGISTGIYTVEEVQDMPTQQVKEMGEIEIVETPAPPQELLDSALAAANQGWAAYGEFWKELPEDKRKLIGPKRHADYKASAQDVPA